MNKNAHETLSYKDVYEEIGRNYRYFLNWRHALFAGYLLVLYAVISSYVESIDNLFFQRLCLGAVVLISLVFWTIEIRIRDLYRACTEAGEDLEKKTKSKGESSSFGIYTKLNNGEMRRKKISHTNALNLLFLSVIIVASTILFFSF
ncbi:MAG TPA: hypothetical protein PLF42_07350 [Anaerolineales bacterium]|nr:hypothetical protein [Anaerolineales bacterium]